MSKTSPTFYSYFLKSVFNLYRPFLAGLLTIYFKNKTFVFLRNSSKLGYARFPMSDLDLTIYIADQNHFSRSRINTAFQILRIALPLCREANIYTSSTLNVIKKHFNFYELSRDPNMAGHIGLTLPQESRVQYHAFVFLLKMFLVDYKNLIHKPVVRLQKWQHHFKLVGLSDINANQVSYAEVLSRIISVLRLSDLENKKVLESIERYISFAESGEPIHDLSYEFSDFPLIPVIFFPQFAYAKFTPPKIETWHLDLIKHLIDWEIIGCSGQIYLGNPILSEHLKNLVQGIDYLQSLSDNIHIFESEKHSLLAIKSLVENTGSSN